MSQKSLFEFFKPAAKRQKLSSSTGNDEAIVIDTKLKGKELEDEKADEKEEKDDDEHEHELDENEIYRLSTIEELPEFQEQGNAVDACNGELPSIIDKLIESCPKRQRHALVQFLASSEEAITPSTSTSLMDKFHQFALREENISKRNIKHLIRPSGCLSAKLALVLHYPSFTSKYIEDGQVADETSPCPRLLLRCGFSPDSALWMERYWRRERPNARRTSPIKQWSTELRMIHEEFTDWCERNSTAKVVVMFGKENRCAAITRESLIHFVANFDGNINIDVSLEIVQDKIWRVILYAYHPEYLYRNPSMQVAKTYDMILSLAALIADIKSYKHGHFTRRAKVLEEQGIVGRVQGDNALHDAIQLSLFEKATNQAVKWEELPGGIIRWIQDETGATNQEDIQRLITADNTIVNFILGRLTSKGGVVKAAKEKAAGLLMPTGLDIIRENNRAKASNLQSKQTESSSTQPSSILVMCAKCKNAASQITDHKPTWEMISGKYISRKRSSCRTTGCCEQFMSKGKKPAMRRKEVDFIPVDRTIAFVYARNLSAQK